MTNGPRIVATTGFWYSGSSAISDFLLDHTACISFADKDAVSPYGADYEPRLIRGEWEAGLGHLLQLLRRDVVPGNPPNFAEIYRESVLGSARGDFDQVMNTHLRTRLGHDFIEAFEELVAAIAALDKSVPLATFHKTCQTFYARAFRTIPGWSEASVVVCNNDPPSMFGSIESALEAYPNCRGIAVLRDPRDMYQEVARFVGGKFEASPGGATAWITAIQKALTRFAPLATHPAVLTTTFEAFVRDPAERERVRAFADAPPVLRDTRKFDPQISAKNIGVYRGMEAELIRRVEAEVVPLYCTILSAAGLPVPTADA